MTKSGWHPMIARSVVSQMTRVILGSPLTQRVSSPSMMRLTTRPGRTCLWRQAPWQ